MNRFVALLLLAMTFDVVCQAQDATTTVKSQSSDKHIQIYNSLNYGLSPQIMGVDLRNSISLDGEWRAIVDQYEVGYYDYRLNPNPDPQTYFANKSLKQNPRVLVEYDYDNDMSLPVPSDWNTRYDKLYYYEGTIWYRKEFDFKPEPGKRYFLYFGAVDESCQVYVNGKLTGTRIFKNNNDWSTPFAIEITSAVDWQKKDQNIIVRVEDTSGQGGIWKPVWLVSK